LKPGDVVSITYYAGKDQVAEPLWTVAEYDNGIVRLDPSASCRRRSKWN